MQLGRAIVVASVLASTAAATRCGGSVGVSSDASVDAPRGSDVPDAIVAPTSDATLTEGDVVPGDVAVDEVHDVAVEEVHDEPSVDAIEGGTDAGEGAADAGSDGANAAAPCVAGTMRCSGSWTEQCTDAGAWVKFGLVACYYGCYGAGICSYASCPSSCASDNDCVPCPHDLQYPYCCDQARGVCSSVSVGCSGSTDAGPG